MLKNSNKDGKNGHSLSFSDSKRADIKGMTAPILNTSKKDTKNEKIITKLKYDLCFWLNIFQSLVMFKKINCSFIFFPKKKFFK